MQYILFDPAHRTALLPLAYTRPIACFRLGILTIAEKWKHLLGQPCSYLTEEYLSHKFPLQTAEENIVLNGAICPNDELAEQVQQLDAGQCIKQDELLIAAKVDETTARNFDPEKLYGSEVIQYKGQPLTVIRNLWDIFLSAGYELENDLHHILNLRYSNNLSASNTVIGDQLFVDPAADIEGATINSSTGPVYIGPEAEVMEGAMIRGPFALGAHSKVKMGAKIYGPTTIGPWAKIGGEINNSVFFGYSNKAHDGFLGNSVIGEWCNLGADTNNSNLKNNYTDVKLWNYDQERFQPTGLQFCGLMMGDHSKCGINTMFNTGTVVGVSANIYGSGFPRNFIPSFSWGGAHGLREYRLQKAFEVCEAVMKRRDVDFTEEDQEILTHIFDMSAKYRKS